MRSRDAFLLPPGVEGLEESARNAALPRDQSPAGKRQQDVIPAQCGAAGRALEQERVSIGIGELELAQIDVSRNLASDRGAGFQSGARNTRLPLVPPKPNEFDMAILTLARLATFGT